MIFKVFFLKLHSNCITMHLLRYRYPVIPSNQIQQWINCIGLLMSALPDSYWMILHNRLVETVRCTALQQWKYSRSPFDMFNFTEVNNSWVENKFVYMLALAHAMWHHAGVGQISAVPLYVQNFFFRKIKEHNVQITVISHVGLLKNV